MARKTRRGRQVERGLTDREMNALYIALEDFRQASAVEISYEPRYRWKAVFARQVLTVMGVDPKRIRLRAAPHEAKAVGTMTGRR